MPLTSICLSLKAGFHSVKYWLSMYQEKTIENGIDCGLFVLWLWILVISFL